MKHSRNPNDIPYGLSALSMEEREKFLRLIGANLPDENLKNRIEVALDMISKAPEDSMDQAMADEIKKTEFAAWQAFEAHKEVLVFGDN
jgi:hypothetical protein